MRKGAEKMGAEMSCSEGRNCGEGMCSNGREGEERGEGSNQRKIHAMGNPKENVPMPPMAKSRAQHKVVQVCP